TKQKLDKLPTPEGPSVLVFKWPGTVTEREPGAVVRVPEREFSAERKEKDILSNGAPNGHPLGTVPDERLSPVAARAMALEGPHAQDAERKASELIAVATASMRPVA